MADSNLLLLLLVVMILFECTTSDFSSDQAECTNQLVGLSTCLPYVQGNAGAPTPDCCTGLKEVIDKSPKCLCILIKDRNDPHLGIKINISLALALPDSCRAPANITDCPRLLKLPSNSPEAEIFKQPHKAAQGNATNDTDNGKSTSAQESSNGMSYHLRRKKWLRLEKFGGFHIFLLLVVLPLLVL